MFFKAQELTQVFVNNKVLTKYTIENTCVDASISLDNLNDRLTTAAFDEASIKSCSYNSMFANLTKYNLQFQKQHDRMHAIQLPFKWLQAVASIPRRLSPCVRYLRVHDTFSQKTSRNATKFYRITRTSKTC